MSTDTPSPVTVRLPRAGSASDEQLVAAIRSGSEAAVSALVERYEAPLQAFARNTLGSGRHHDAEDVVQDALINAIGAMRRRPDVQINLRPWLHTIVKNRCLDQLRKPNRTTDLQAHAFGLRDNGPGPVSQIAGRAKLDELMVCLDELPERQRRALVMLEFEQCSHSMIGRTLGVTGGASKALVCRARRGMAEAVSFTVA